jgi:heterotetrameric sarcosine oxidase gamma subunit
VAEHSIGSAIPGHYGASGSGLVLSEATIGAAWNLQGDPVRAGFASEAERLFGVALPLVPNTSRREGKLVAFWLGPKSWLLVESVTSGDPMSLSGIEGKRESVNGAGGALFDVSASRVAYTIRGPAAEAVLAKVCPLDLDQRVFAKGHCAQSLLGRIAALFYRHESAPAFRVMVARSLAADAWRELCLAAAAHGYEVHAPGPLDAAR